MLRRRRETFDPTELARGRQHEMEHVDDPQFAEIIARDHLRERPDYYQRLEECMPHGSCPACRPQTNPGFVKTAADEHIWERAKTEAGRTYRVGSKSYWRVANMIFHRVKAAHQGRRNPEQDEFNFRPRGRLVRDATIMEKREWLHQNIDELLYPRTARQRVDVGALRRVAEDVGSDTFSALSDLLDDPTLADDFEWLPKELMRDLHHQVSSASVNQIETYTGPFYRVRR